MALITKDRIKEDTTTTGTGAYALGGSSATFDTFQSCMSNGDTTYYAVAHTTSGTDEWEVGLGTWNTGNTLARTTVLAGSNGTSAVNFSAGTKNIFMTVPADQTRLGLTATTAELNILDGVTATAAELNILDGVTSTAAELNILDGVTSTAAELNILDGVTSTAAELNILDGVTATATELNLLDGVTATTAELNYVDGVTSNVQTQLDTKGPHMTIAVTVSNPGSGNKYYLDGALQQTALLPKSVTIRFDQSDSSNASHPLRLSTTSNGTHASGSAFTTGVTEVGTPGSAGAYTQVTLEQDAPDVLYYYCGNHSGMGGTVYSGKDFSTLTSTVAELNILDGVTSTAAELNILDGVTSTATELNLLDGVTATTAELNYVDGVTSNVQTQLDAKLPLAGGTLTGGLRQDVDTVAGGGSTVNIDLSAANNFKVNMTADTTFTFSNKDAGRFGNIVFVQDGTGGHDFTLPSECKTPVNGATIVQSTGANEVSVLGYFVLDSSNILVNYIGDFA
tara:strand:+ start:712 stop:2238 length:1527 start_codon:yes stop_codon:yes gene_type:complete